MAKPKLSDVAALAGVSPTTVSRVLNNRGYLSEATRQGARGRPATRLPGPTPSPEASAGSALPDGGSHLPTVANPFYGEMVYQLENHLADAGYRVILCNSEDHPRAGEALSRYALRQSGGWHHNRRPFGCARERPACPGPLVTIDRRETGFYPNIRSDNYGGARAATEHLIATGAQTIVHVTSTLGEHNERQRVTAKQCSMLA